MKQLEAELQGLITKDPAIVNENANKDSNTFSTMRDLTAGVVSKSYALQHLLPKRVAQAHKNGDIHFHDLDYHPFQPLTNCCLIDATSMLQHGFELGTPMSLHRNQFKRRPHNLYKLLPMFLVANMVAARSTALMNYLVHMHDIMKHITAKLLKHLLEQML